MDAVLKKIHLPVILGVLSLFFGCREPFSPELKDLNQNILVVEGFIEVGGGTTSIKLSMASPLYSDIPEFPVPGANITIFGENGDSWELNTDNFGAYVTDAILPEAQNLTSHLPKKMEMCRFIVTPRGMMMQNFSYGNMMKPGFTALHILPSLIMTRLQRKWLIFHWTN